MPLQPFNDPIFGKTSNRKQYINWWTLILRVCLPRDLCEKFECFDKKMARKRQQQQKNDESLRLWAKMPKTQLWTRLWPQVSAKFFKSQIDILINLFDLLKTSQGGGRAKGKSLLVLKNVLNGNIKSMTKIQQSPWLKVCGTFGERCSKNYWQRTEQTRWIFMQDNFRNIQDTYLHSGSFIFSLLGLRSERRCQSSEKVLKAKHKRKKKHTKV